jgi:hypothetical protein
MRRKNRKWVAIAVGLYLFVMWSAYRWSVGQRIPEGNIFVRIEHEGIRRQAVERERAAKEQGAPPAGETRLSAAGPAFVAARYDATHVVFVVATDTESRFSNSPLNRSSGTPTRISAPAKPAAPLAGLDELWEPDSHSLHFFPEIVQKTRPGEQWNLSLSADTNIPVVIDRVVLVPTGCSLALGFLASVPSEHQAEFAASSSEYFAVRRAAVEPANPALAVHLGELRDWKPSLAIAKQIEHQLNARMKEELAKIDSRLIGNAASPGATSAAVPIGDARPRLKEWLHADEGLARGEGVLDYDVRAYRLTPDQAPRLFVRARWKLADAPVFLMTAWFNTDSFNTAPVKTDASPDGAPTALLSADSSWARAMRDGQAPVSLGDRLDFQTILNEFDADRDGWAELLVHSHEAQSSQTTSTTIALYLYTDKGLVPLKAPFRRDTRSPESCLDP